MRAQLLDDGPPTEHGYVAWRGVVPQANNSSISATATEIYGHGERFGIGPLGKGKVGWWASINKSLMPDQKQADGRPIAHRINQEDHASIREELLRLFGGWCAPVPDLIRATPLTALVKNPVCDRRPVKKWGEGCVTLMGDAIHPVTPNLGQGGCLAIEDAALLARCLGKCGSSGNTVGGLAPAAIALRRYESLRYPRTAWVARYSRVYGIVGQWENGGALRDLFLSLVPNRVTARFLRGIFEYDAWAIGI
jgi:2-polyprenyl-6-methoxyphenol hydroxylase-like FAD-dependent oxidoreductase